MFHLRPVAAENEDFLYRAYPKDWTVARKPKLGPPKVRGGLLVGWGVRNVVVFPGIVSCPRCCTGRAYCFLAAAAGLCCCWFSFVGIFVSVDVWSCLSCVAETSECLGRVEQCCLHQIVNAVWPLIRRLKHAAAGRCTGIHSRNVYGGTALCFRHRYGVHGGKRRAANDGISANFARPRCCQYLTLSNFVQSPRAGAALSGEAANAGGDYGGGGGRR